MTIPPLPPQNLIGRLDCTVGQNWTDGAIQICDDPLGLSQGIGA